MKQTNLEDLIKEWLRENRVYETTVIIIEPNGFVQIGNKLDIEER